jgi:hypothetical protein
MGHPRSVVAPADSRFLTGLSARFGMTKVFLGMAEVRVYEIWGRVAFFSPYGAGDRLLLLTHGLRRGLHSFAASRLGSIC